MLFKIDSMLPMPLPIFLVGFCHRPVVVNQYHVLGIIFLCCLSEIKTPGDHNGIRTIGVDQHHLVVGCCMFTVKHDVYPGLLQIAQQKTCALFELFPVRQTLTSMLRWLASCNARAIALLVKLKA